VASKENKNKYLEAMKLETMTLMSNISLNKILEKIPCMFVKQNYGHVFQLVKRCYVLIGIRHYELNGEVSNIVAHGKGEGADVPRLMFSGIFTLSHELENWCS
jgi:hypothetical protein